MELRHLQHAPNPAKKILMPIAGLILTLVMTLELIQFIVTNTWNIVMGVFDMAQSVVNSATGLIGSETSTVLP
jgi:hypothetical protein